MEDRRNDYKLDILFYKIFIFFILQASFVVEFEILTGNNYICFKFKYIKLPV